MDKVRLEWLKRHALTDFDEIPLRYLGNVAQMCGQSGRGTREELVQKIKAYIKRQEESHD